ncbi:MAG: ABC transporter substrate-binding protein [Myxococcota bacterium]
MKKLIVSTLLMLAGLLLASNVAAASATDFVRAEQSKLFDVIAQPKTAARQSQLKSMFDDIFAYDVLAKKSLGKEEWTKRSAEERKRFSDLLTRLVRNNYRRNLENMLNYEISYVGEENKGSTTVVRTLAKHGSDDREPDVHIDFRVMKVAGRWRVVDLITEEASLVKTYRSQFLRIIRKDGFEALITKMQKKADKEDA